MIPLWLPVRLKQLASAATAAAAAIAALTMTATPQGAMLWTIAVVIGCAGYGRLFGRLGGQRASFGMAAVLGLGALLLLSTGLARVGLLTRDVQIAATMLGIATWVLPDVGDPVRRPGWAMLGLVLGSALVVLTIQTVETGVYVADGANHGLLIKCLWDTGSLGLIHHQTGAQLVGEAFVALGGGAQTAPLFDAGVCRALLIVLLATELAINEGTLHVPILIVLALGIAFDVDATAADDARWSATLFIVAAFLSLRRALTGIGGAWQVLVLALALLAIRYEYVYVTVPLITAVFVLPRLSQVSRRAAISTIVGCWLTLLVVELVFRTPFGSALVRALLAMLVVPTVGIALRAVGSYGWRSAFGVTLFSAGFYAFGIEFDILPYSFRGPAAPIAIAHAVIIIVLVLVGDATREKPVNGRFKLAAVALVPIIWTFALVPTPLMSDKVRGGLRDRFVRALSTLHDLRWRGYELDAEDRVRALQDHVPVKVPIGFWGQSAARLDFGRNRIVDVSWPVNPGLWRFGYLTPIDVARLKRIEYLIVEQIHPAGSQDQDWVTPSILSSESATMLEPVADLGPARLYRIRR